MLGSNIKGFNHQVTKILGLEFLSLRLVFSFLSEHSCLSYEIRSWIRNLMRDSLIIKM